MRTPSRTTKLVVRRGFALQQDGDGIGVMSTLFANAIPGVLQELGNLSFDATVFVFVLNDLRLVILQKALGTLQDHILMSLDVKLENIRPFVCLNQFNDSLDFGLVADCIDSTTRLFIA